MAKNHYSVDLIKQIAECDANYIRLLKILPELSVYRDKSWDRPEKPLKSNSLRALQEKLQGLKASICIADIDNTSEKVTVDIEIVETFKYTTTLQISQKPELKQWMTNASMLVRIYHDACTAEVVSYQGHKNLQARYPEQNPNMYHPDEKMQVNKFLGEWLSHCLKAGRSTQLPEIAT